jgi:putative oxidoreductase
MSPRTIAQQFPGGALETHDRSFALDRVLILISRACFSAIFITAAPGHFTSGAIAYAEQQGVPMAAVLVPLSGVLAFLGGVSVLVGFRARLGAWMLVLFLVPVTVMMHNFWSVADPAMARMQYAMFMKNLAMLGGALMITHFGAGPLSLDHR